ncbi:MAG: amidohydrolase family protein [Thermoproteota archaeon]
MNEHSRKIIDCHTHIGYYRDIHNKNSPWSKVNLENLISFLNDLKTYRAVVLPLCSWNVDAIMPTEYVLEACSKYPERLIPFCAVEVREQCFEDRVLKYVEMGCKGFGEHTSKLPIDHELNLSLYRLCSRLEIPILIHLAFGDAEIYGAMDSPDLRGLERVVKEHSNLDFIMHGPGWWSCISNEPPKESYPKGPVKEPGRTFYLLSDYHNVFGDLSAGSGFNALSRDLKFAREMLQRLDRKMLYGTDLDNLFTPDEVHVSLLENLKLTDEALENIYHKNIEKLLNI